MRRRWIWAAGLLALASLAAGGVVRAETAARTEVPIGQVRLSDGSLRYWVPVSVGSGAPIEAMLDTGSFGLRVLERALSPTQYQPTEIERIYGYASGAQLHGVVAEAVVSVGGATTSTPVPIQVVHSVDCNADKPDCPVSRVRAEDYRIGGDGLPGEGFQAILGLSLRTPPVKLGVINPLPSVGADAWIVALPQPGETGPGQLIINPDQAELSGFKLYQMPHQPSRDAGDQIPPPGWIDTAVPACPGSTHKSNSCNSMRLDSGAREGLKPFYSYAVLYDDRRGMIGLKARR